MSRWSLGRAVNLSRLHEYSSTALFVIPFVWGEYALSTDRKQLRRHRFTIILLFKNFVSDLAGLCIQDDCPNDKTCYFYFAVTAAAEGSLYRRCRQLPYLGIRNR